MLLFYWKRMNLSMFRPLKYPMKHLCSQGRVGPMIKGLSLTVTWNQDAAGTRPWCQWADGLLHNRSQKLAILKQSWIPGSSTWWVKLYHQHPPEGSAWLAAGKHSSICPIVHGFTHHVSFVSHHVSFVSLHDWTRKFVWCFGCCASTEYSTGAL